MASFTDTNIPKFNPYVQQLPVEAMVQVGMQKQAQYEQGVTKIQNQINNIAGMDVMKDVDKNYLQSRLNQLGNDLTTVAAGDFSNFQLVNSVGGMATQISKDKYVQNAVNSTARYRNEVKRIDEARKKGKSDKNNEDFFYNEANKWMNDDVVGSTFSNSFVEYTDIMKVIRENVTAAGIDSKYIEQMFETDGRGNILRDKNNHPIPARVMTTETLDTNATKVRDIVANVMSQGDVKQQLYVDGWANTRNVPVESIYNTFVEDFNVRDADNSQNILLLQTLIDSDNITSEERDALVKQQNSIKEIQEHDIKKLADLSKKATENPEQFKIDYYQDSYTNNLINAFTTVKSKKENKDSPLRKQLNWEEDMDFKRNKEAFDRKIALATASRDERRLQLETLKFDAEYEIDPTTGQYRKIATDDGTKKKPNAIRTDTPSEINAENKGSEVDAMSTYTGVTSDIQADAQQKGFDLIYTYLYKANNGKNKSGDALTKTDVLTTIKAFAKSTGETPYQFILRFSGDLKNKSQLTGVKLSVQELEKVDEVTRLHNNITTRLAVTEDIYKQVKNETGIDPRKLKLDILNPTVIKDWNGKPITITAQDKLDIGLRWANLGPVSTSAKNRLEQKFGRGPIDNAFALFDINNFIGYREIQKVIGQDPSFQNAIKVTAEKFKKVNVVSDNFSSTLSGTDAQLTTAKANVLALFNAQRLEKSEQEAVAAVLTSPGGGVTYDARRPTKEGELWTGTIYVTDKQGKKHSVDVDQTNLEIITGRVFNPYVEDGLRARANVSEFGSTNLGAFTTDPNAYTSAAIKSGSFTSLENSDYTAFADVIPLSGGKLGIAIYAKDKSMNKFERIEMVPIKKVVNGVPIHFTDYNEINGVIPNITPAMLKNALTKLKQK